MNNIECIINNRSYNLAIDKYKIIYGTNYSSKYNIYKCIKYFFNKVPLSEYSKENNNKALVKINGNYLDTKETLFFEIGYEYDYGNDAKLSTKSLILKYFEYALEGIEYEDSFNTVKELLYSLINIELEDRVNIGYENILFGIENDDFNYKSIIKLLVPMLSKDNLESNSLDLTYEESIIFQLKLINKIGKLSNKNILVLANIPEINSQILEALEELNKEVYMIIFSNNYIDRISIENMILTDFGWLDLANEDNIFEYITNSPFTFSIAMFKSKLQEALNNYSLKKIFYKK